MEHKINRPVLFSTLILLIIALSLSDHQKVPSVSSPLTQVNAQSSKTSQSKTNELISSKFRESITQFRRKQQQPIQQQQITKTSQVNEERMIGQNQIVEQHQQEQLNIRQQQRLDQSFEIQQEQQQHSSLDSSESIYGAVKGTPGVDFPNYSTIPNTKFSCDGVPFEPGMYADEATGCQVYHLCYQGRRESFLCGLGTVFNQAILNCDFWYSVECSKSSQHYGLNVEFGKSSSEPVGGNVQSISQSSFSQFQQSQIPIQQQQQQVIKQTYEVVVPSRPSFVRNEDMNIQSFRQTTGKVSPPKQQFASNFVAQSLQASAGGTKSIPPPIIEQARQISTQRKSSSGFLSPGRKAAQLNGVMSMFQQQQFASAESSPMRTFTTGVGTKGSSDASRRGSQRVGSPLIVSSAVVSSDINSKETSYSNSKAPGQFENNIDVGDRVQASGGGNLGSSKQHSTKLIKNTPSLTTGTKTFDQSSAGRDDIDVWKPYFRNRTKTGEKPSAAGTIPAAPVNKGTSSTTPSSNTGENTAQDSGGDASSTPEPASPTLAQPDQEPTFSSEQNTSSSIEPTTTNQDIPSVPKSSVPPPSSSTSTEEPADSESPAVIESGVSSALSTTTPADMNDSSGAPTTTTTAATPTTSITTTTPVTIVTTSDAPSATEPAPTTTTSSAPTTAETPSSSSPETSTTTAQTAPSETTIATPTEPTATVMTTKTQVDDDVSSSATNDKRGAEDDEQNKKKKRGTLTAGVEYAKNGSSTAKPSARANSSSIEYVANMKQGSSSSRTSSS